MDMEDHQLIAQSLAGHRDAFAELLVRHAAPIHRYLSRRSSTETADDLLSEVWLQAFRSRSSYDCSCHDARPWLYGIARNVLYRHWRQTETVGYGHIEATVNPWDEVDDSLDAEAKRSALRSGLHALRPEDRDVLLMVAWEGLGPSEAAEALGIPAGTARWRLHRARRVFSAAYVSALPSATPEATTREV